MSKKKSIFSNFIWRFAERCGAQGITFIVSIVLARILLPEAYGQIALVTVFINILQVFVDSGLGNALIQKKDTDDLDFSTVFYANLISCSILYIILFFTAPFIASFYKMPELTNIIRVLGVMLIISGVKNIQQAYISKQLIFKKFFFATLIGTIGSAIAGILMAYIGFGVWALVAQMLFNTLIDTIMLWITVKWRPKLLFSFSRFKKLFTYGWKLLASNLIDTVYKNCRSLFIGKLYTAEDLAYFNRGNQFPKLVITNVNASLDSVLFPVMSEVQDNVAEVKRMTRRAIMLSSYVIWPIMVGMAVCARPFIRLILTDKWLFCVPYLQMFCIVYAFWPIHTANLNAIKAVGRSDIFIKLEIVKKTIDITALLISLPFGVYWIAISSVITAPISALINAFPNKKILHYGYKEQLKDMLPEMGLSLVMGVVVYMVTFFNINDIVTLNIQVILGVIIYIGMSKLLHISSYEYIEKIVIGIFNKIKNAKKVVN